MQRLVTGDCLVLLRSRKEAEKPGGAGAERGPEKEAGLGPVGKEF